LTFELEGHVVGGQEDRRKARDLQLLYERVGALYLVDGHEVSNCLGHGLLSRDFDAVRAAIHVYHHESNHIVQEVFKTQQKTKDHFFAERRKERGMAEQSTAVSLEAFSLGYASMCCFFYGILGVVTVCTTNCEKSADGDSYSGSIKMTPILASFYCSMVLIMGYVIWKFRYSTQNVVSYLQNTSWHEGTRTMEGHEYTTMSMRLLLSLGIVSVVVIVLAKFILLGPLEACQSLDQKEAPFLFSLRVTMKKMEFWVVGTGILFLGIAYAFNRSEAAEIEAKVKNHTREANLQQGHQILQVVPANHWTTNPGGYTLKPNWVSTQGGGNQPDHPVIQQVAVPAQAGAAQAGAARAGAAQAGAAQASTAAPATPAAARAAPSPASPQRSPNSPNSKSIPNPIGKKTAPDVQHDFLVTPTLQRKWDEARKAALTKKMSDHHSKSSEGYHTWG